MIKIQSLYIYPVKSLSGIKIQTMEFDELGPKHDRRYMLIDNNNLMMTQRNHPILARFNTQLLKNNLIISYLDDSINIDLASNTNKKVKSALWDDEVFGLEVSQEISDWFSKKLESNVKFIKYDNRHPRTMDSKYVNTRKQVGFADGFQILITQQSSLEALGLEENEDMERFRPNIVLEGGHPFSEDYWRQIKINELLIDIVKPCARCSMPAVNPLDGSRQPIVIRKLAQTRLFNKEIYFGQNAFLSMTFRSSISTGDSIIITKQSSTSNITY
ncbi:MOSC domain-containing protein [Marinicellulosiphila megalodicopiae]|uniref:MOSC domain-containing protein n=1 Tax=Marinicellulosiphila megalodicopiae TaxID=2724896 RepID=UPI003BB0FE64